MKSFKLTCLIVSALMLHGAIAQQSNIYAVVEGNIVTLWETAAYRNCGADYRMEIDQSEFQVNWYQLDSGMAAFCLCHFDLSVTYGPLEPGIYHSDVFYTESWTGDTLYSGSTDFVIESGRGQKYSGVISQYQSDCYTVGITDNAISKEEVISIHPNPLTDNRILTIDLPHQTNYAHLKLFNTTGKLIYSKNYLNVKEISLSPLQDLIVLRKGVTIVRIQTTRGVYSGKIIVL